nr:MFS transporter [Brevibacillus sp. WF146]
MLNKPFCFLWMGQSLANLGDVFYVVAVISAVYAATDSAVFTAMVPVLFVAAQAVSGFLAPLVFQRMPLLAVLIMSQGAKTLLLFLATRLVAGSGAHAQAVLSVLVLVFAIAFLDGWAAPARNALVPRLVERERLLRANGLLAATDQSVQFAGWAAGGLLVAWLGHAAVLWGTSAAYLLATVALIFVHPVSGTERREDDKGLLAGWRAIGRNRRLRLLVAIDVLEGWAGAVWVAAIMLPFVTQVLKKGEAWWGYLNAAYMLGSIAGGAVMLALASRLRDNLPRWVTVGTGASGLVTLLFGASGSPVAALVFSFALGPVFQLQAIAKQTMLQQAAGEADLPVCCPPREPWMRWSSAARCWRWERQPNGWGRAGLISSPPR